AARGALIPLPPSLIRFMSRLLRRPLYRANDSRVRSTTTDVGAHVVYDLLAARPRLLLQQCRGAHDLPGLAIAALRHLLRDPRLLQRMAGIRREPFDRGHAAPREILDRVEAGVVRLAVDVYRARAALPGAAAELRPRELEILAQDPQQRRVRQRGDGMALAVDGERGLDHLRHEASSIRVCVIILPLLACETLRPCGRKRRRPGFGTGASEKQG